MRSLGPWDLNAAVSVAPMGNGTVFVTLSGNDRPGVTRTVCATLAEFDVEVLDMQQIVMHGHLLLSILITTPRRPQALPELRDAIAVLAARLEMTPEVMVGDVEVTDSDTQRVQVTVMGRPLLPATVSAVAALIAQLGGNIDRIRRIASYPVTAIMLEGSGASVIELRTELSKLSASSGVDIAVQNSGLDRRGQHLVVMDVDSTVIQDEVIDLLADEAGVMDQVAAITERAMAGELDFAASLRARVALLAGLDAHALEVVRDRITLTPGARTLCRTLNALGYRVCLVSGGFTEVIEPLALDLGVDEVRANTLEIIDGKLTGQVLGDIVDRAGKRIALEEFAAKYAIPMRRTIAIGDGANDIDMLQAAALGIAFNAKSAAREAADASVSVPYLDSVLYLMGITRQEIQDADAERGVVTPSPPVE